MSPEISISSLFCKSVLSKPQVTSKLRAVCIDEAHCVSLWGGSFREDYANIGVLCGQIPSNVPFMVSSATLPDHILDDVCVKLGLANDSKTISLTNARPNIALSCRPMKYSEESKADLRFLIPLDAMTPDDINITLVYCNEWLTTEDQCDAMQRWAKEANIPESCIAFYHAKIGSKRKREIEEQLRRGEIQILFCTDAVGMASHSLSALMYY